MFYVMTLPDWLGNIYQWNKYRCRFCLFPVFVSAAVQDLLWQVDRFLVMLMTQSYTVRAPPPNIHSEKSYNDPLHVTMKLHRATLLDGVIIQFKDEATTSYSGKCSFDAKMGADDGAASRNGICCLLDRISGWYCSRSRCEGAVIIPKMARGRMEICW